MLLLFWPFMFVSILFAVIAIIKKKPVLLVISCLLIIPFSLYLAATPLFKGWGLILPFCYLGSALAVRKNMQWFSIVLIVPIIILISWLGVVVMTQ